MNRWTGRYADIQEWLYAIRKDPKVMDHVTYWHTIPSKEAKVLPFPEALHPRLKQTLQSQGVRHLYTHQAEAFKKAREGRHIVTVTPTASGKTLCYNLPVLQSILEDAGTRALYLFPTKALAQDQLTGLYRLIQDMEADIKTFTYDGDTPPSARQAIRQAGQIVVTNPDMLHAAILPHHTKWVKWFEQLRYVIIDEIHAYRGVFGSHVANVIRRLKRICRFYGSNPQFICASATIANPQEHAEQFLGEPVHKIDNNGAPSGEKHFILYNPPVVNQQLGIRRSSVLETQKLASMLLKQGIQTIVFARSRVRVEILLTYLQDQFRRELGSKSIRGYRGGYLPSLRREIEHGLRNGEIQGVVSTNALELGIDIGQLQACVLNGYPGNIASTWQQSGRAGRSQETAVTFMVASSNPLDQYMIQHPEFFFEQSPEQAFIHPDNVMILMDQLKCAAYELPFEADEPFGSEPVVDMLEFLEEERTLHRTGEKFYWMEQSFPAHNISLRSAAQENFVIIDQSEGNRVIGEVDRFSAPTLIHEEAIYLHDGQQYQVEKLDYDEKKAYVRLVNVDYFTDANLAVHMKVLHCDQTEDGGTHRINRGEVTVNAKATIFKKIKLRTHENIGSGPIHLPEEELHTTAYWLTFSPDILPVASVQQLQAALVGLANVMIHIAPVYLMCDPYDIRVVPQIRDIHEQQPSLYFYDRYPGGIGLSDQLYQLHRSLLEEANHLIASCGCLHGCPACVGPEETELDSKTWALKLAQALLAEHEGVELA